MKQPGKKNPPRVRRGLVLVLSAVVIAIGPFACDNREPIKVGFVGGLTGRLSDLGTAGRNGVILAVEEVNAAGGIHGRPVALITGDDRQDPQAAVSVDQRLIEQGVVAIVGHMTSSMSMAAVPLINEKKVLMISPTTSTNQLSGLDDYFLRVMPPNRSETDHLARYAFDRLGLRNLAAVYDLSNRAYSEGFFRNFRSEFENLGGRVVRAHTVSSGSGIRFRELIDSLLADTPDGLLLVAGAPDAALICQHLRRAGAKLPIIAGGWAMTDDFIDHGGPAVEGVVFSHLLEKESRHERFVRFRRQFADRFREEPNFAAGHGYEAARILFQALAENDDPASLKATILRQKAFPGIQGDFAMDRYGDPVRGRFLIVVKNGRFETLVAP